MLIKTPAKCVLHHSEPTMVVVSCTEQLLLCQSYQTKCRAHRQAGRQAGRRAGGQALLLLPADCSTALHCAVPVCVVCAPSQGKECKIEKQYGERRQGFIKSPNTATYQVAAKVRWDTLAVCCCTGGVVWYAARHCRCAWLGWVSICMLQHMHGHGHD